MPGAADFDVSLPGAAAGLSCPPTAARTESKPLDGPSACAAALEPPAEADEGCGGGAAGTNAGPDMQIDSLRRLDE